MTKIQKLTLGIIFTFLSINMLGCSEGGTTVSSSPPTILVSPTLDFDFGTVTEGNIASHTANFQLDTMNATNPCLTASPALSTGESCTVEVIFNPIQFDTFPTDLATVLTINSNALNAPSKILNIAGTSEQVSSSLNVTINQVDTATCPNVVAYVSVTDQSNFPVKDLELLTDAFTITEGVTVAGPPTSTTVGDAVEPISIAIVMDNSGSMQAIDIAEMNKAATEVVLKLADGGEAEIIKFDKTVYVVREFTANEILLADAIDSPFAGSGDGTAIYDAVQRAILDTKSQLTERKAIIVITDGKDRDSTATLDDIVDGAIAEGIPIFVIALGDFDQNIIDNVLKPIAKNTSGEFYKADVAQNFSTIIEQKLTEVLFTDQYILSYVSGSSGSGTDVGLTISVDVDSLGTTTGSSIIKPVASCP
jgi:Ca-activated chloride channel family protein